MRALVATSVLALALLAGCAQPQYLFSEPATAPPTAGTQAIPLHIGSDFSTFEQDKILAGVHDWNSGQKGDLRLDVAVP